MVTEFSCTYYKYNNVGYARYYISECHWEENRASNVLKSGLQTADSVIVYIPSDVSITAPNNKNISLGELFENASSKNVTKDMLVKGKCDFEFKNITQQSVSESMNKFRTQYPQFLTVSSIDNKLYGLKELQHFKISAK